MAVEIAQQVVAYLTTGTISNAVNVPSIPREVAPVLSPYLALARRLGQFLAQVEALEPRTIEVECAGEAGKLTLGPIVNSALAGVLERFFESQVNQVNAPVLAKDRGIEVRELKTGEDREYRTLVTLERDRQGRNARQRERNPGRRRLTAARALGQLRPGRAARRDRSW